MRPDSLGETFARIKQIEGLLDRLMPEAAPTASPTPTSPGSFQEALAAQLQPAGPAGPEANWLLPADPALAGTTSSEPTGYAANALTGATDSRGWEKNLPSAAIAREMLTGGASFATRTTSAGAAARVPDEYRRLARQAARKYGVDEALVLAVIQTESNFNPRAVSRAGAMGLMQLMPANVTEYGIRDPFDPAQNVDAGVRHLRDMLRRYRGDVRLALAGYNAGPGNVAKYGGVPPFNETRNYIPKVLARAEAFRQAPGDATAGLALPGTAAIPGRATASGATAAGPPALAPLGPMPVEAFEQRPAPADQAADLPNLANRESAVDSPSPALPATPALPTAPDVAPRSTTVRSEPATPADALAASANRPPHAADPEPLIPGAPDTAEAMAPTPGVNEPPQPSAGVTSRPTQATAADPTEAPLPTQEAAPGNAGPGTPSIAPARPDAPAAAPTATPAGPTTTESGPATSSFPAADTPAAPVRQAPATPPPATPHPAADAPPPAPAPRAGTPPESPTPARRTVPGAVELTPTAWQPATNAARPAAADAQPAPLHEAAGTTAPVPVSPAPPRVSGHEPSAAAIEITDGGVPAPARPRAAEPLLRRVAERLPGVAALSQAVEQAVEPVRQLVESLGDALGDGPAEEPPAPALPPMAVPAAVAPEPAVRPRSGTAESQPGPLLAGGAATGPVPAEAGQAGPDSDSSERHAAPSEAPRRAAPGQNAPVFTLEAPGTPPAVHHTTTPAPVGVDRPEQLTAELVRRAQVLRTPGRDEFSAEVRLPEAGVVSVRVIREAQTLHVSLTCDQPALRRELQAQLPHLESALRDQGLQLGSFDTATHQQQQPPAGGGYQPGPHPSPRYQLAEGGDAAFRDTAAPAAREDDHRPEGQHGLTTWA